MRNKLLLLIVLVSFNPVFAQDLASKDYYFKQIKTHAIVLDNSDILVQENYTYSFEGGFSFVFRSFYLQEIDSIVDFRVWNAETGQVYTPKVISNYNDTIYNWTIDAHSEEQTYVMEYRMVGAIKEFNEEFDSLWYSIVPIEREKRIESVNFWITFPESVDIDVVNRVSSTHTKTKAGDDTILITASDLEPYSSLDARFYLPEGMVEIYLTPRDIISFIFPCILLVVLAFLWYKLVTMVVGDYTKYGRDPVVSEFKKVRNLRPALAGVIVDEKADIKEIEATILDLAVRGYIYIREEEKGTILKKREVWFMKTKNPDKLLWYERKIMNSLFGKKEKIKVSSLKNKFYKKIPGILDSINDEAEKQKLFDRSPPRAISKYSSKFIKYPLTVLLVFLPTFLFIFILHIKFTALVVATLIFYGISTFAMFAIAGISAFSMPRKTELGVAQKQKYIELKDWMRRYPLKEGRLFDEYLPYATALGIQKVWVRKLKDIERYESNWYSGPYNTAGFMVIHSSLISASSAPHGSGGVGGGGFGGGGGAGGGGAGAG